MKKALVLLALLPLAGCASLAGAPSRELARLPVVEVGQKPPADGNYILHIGANQSAPFKLVVDGSALSRSGEATTTVAPKRDIYLYGRWLSFDRKHWKPIRDLFRTRISVGMTAAGGKVEVRFDRKAP